MRSESRMEYIQNRVNDLTEMVSRLSESNRNAASNNASATHSETRAASQSLSNVSTRTVSENDGIETSLFSHAVFAVKVLNAAIANDPASTTAAEMSDALNALQEAITTQDQRNESHERSPPFSTSLKPSQCLADLPHPPLDKIFACLAIAQGRYSHECSTRLMLTSCISATHPNSLALRAEICGHIHRACSEGVLSGPDYGCGTHHSLCWFVLVVFRVLCRRHIRQRTSGIRWPWTHVPGEPRDCLVTAIFLSTSNH